ncbi:hypothetical protein HOG47_08665 [archaeon]|jgi:transcription initiation factor TFIIE subunit alpha|nr:hypothetical protein [archaeon]
MRLTQKKIDEVVIRILGEGGLPLVELLKGKENVSEFDIAKKLNLDIKLVRKMLYLLYNHSLVSFTRKKDKQKGWYIYYWTLMVDCLRYVYIKRKKEVLVQLKEQLRLEKNKVFFQCTNECVRLDFDDSMEFEFRCPECGKLLDQDNSENRVSHLESRISNIEQELEIYKKEMIINKAKIRKKLIKEKEAEKKKEAKALKKENDRKLAVKKKAADKKAAKKKSTKKKIVKKSTKKVVKKKITKKKIVENKGAKKENTKKKAVKKKVTKKKVVKKKKQVAKRKATRKKTSSKK